MTKYKNKNQTMRQKRMAVKQLFLSVSFRAVLLVIIAGFGILYVVQTSSASTKGYEIRDLEGQIQSLEYETQRLEFEIATNRSMKSIQQRLASLNMVVADDIEYATLVGSAVALR
jgi:hypothetical protein